MASLKHNKTNRSDDKTMTLSGHLKELRSRIVVCIICLVVFFLLGMHFAPEIVDNLTGLGKQYGYEYVYLSPQELLLQYFSVAMLAGVIFTLPVILFNIWAFIQPGLKENENGLFLAALIFGLLFFVLGVLFAYKIMFPFMLRFLIGLSTGRGITASISVQNYMAFLLTIFTVMGLVFELPVVCVVLTAMGLLNPVWLRKGRKFIIVGIFFVAAVITPPDIVSQVMVAIPMLGLFELSIILCTIISGRKKTADSQETQ